MMKAMVKLPNGRTMLVLGLSFRNLDKFKAEPRDTFIKVDGKELGLEIDIIICSGETEVAMAEMMEMSIGPDTIVHVSDRLKS
jgi:hypothetical protein